MVGRTKISIFLWSVFFLNNILQTAQQGGIPNFSNTETDPFANVSVEGIAENPFIPSLPPTNQGQKNQVGSVPQGGGVVPSLPAGGIQPSIGVQQGQMMPQSIAQQGNVMQPPMGMQQGPSVQPGGVQAGQVSQPFILKDEKEGMMTTASSDDLYKEAQKMYTDLYESRSNIRALVDQQENQEKDLDNQIDTVARDIGNKAGTIDGTRQDIQEYLVSRSKEINEALQNVLKQKSSGDAIKTLTVISNKIREVSQSLIQLGTLRSSIDTDYKQIKNLKRKVFNLNQLLRNKRNEYSNFVSTLGQLKSTLMEQKTAEVHQSQVEMMRKKKKEAEAKAEEIQKVQFDFQEENQIRNLIQVIQEKLQNLTQQLQGIELSVTEVRTLTAEYATSKDKEIVEKIQSTVAHVKKESVSVMFGIDSSNEKNGSGGIFSNMRKMFSNKKLLGWFKVFTSDVKRKITHDSQQSKSLELTKKEKIKEEATLPQSINPALSSPAVAMPKISQPLPVQQPQIVPSSGMKMQSLPVQVKQPPVQPIVVKPIVVKPIVVKPKKIVTPKAPNPFIPPIG